MSAQWKKELAELVQSTDKSKIAAGHVYRRLGLPTEKQRRSASQTIAVQSLMAELGWIHKSRGTQPCFIRQNNDPIVAVIRSQKAAAPRPVRNLVGLTDRHLHALKIVEESWADCELHGISADFLAMRLGLDGRDIRRVAQRILDTLAERRLVTKVIRSTIKGKTARYLPTGLTTERLVGLDADKLKNQALLLLLGLEGKKFTRDDLCRIVQEGLPCCEEESQVIVDMLLRQQGEHFPVIHRNHGMPPLYVITKDQEADDEDYDNSPPLNGEYRYVYFVQWDNDISHVKIGYSSTPLSRFTSFLTASPHRLLVLGLIVVEGQEEEAFLHTRFQEYRVAGEWFEYDGEVRAFVEGLPKDVLRRKMRALSQSYGDRIKCPVL